MKKDQYVLQERNQLIRRNLVYGILFLTVGDNKCV